MTATLRNGDPREPFSFVVFVQSAQETLCGLVQSFKTDHPATTLRWIQRDDGKWCLRLEAVGNRIYPRDVLKIVQSCVHDQITFSGDVQSLGWAHARLDQAMKVTRLEPWMYTEFGPLEYRLY